MQLRRKMNYLKLLILLIVFVFSSKVNALELRKGLVVGDDKWMELTKTDREAGYNPTSVVESNEVGVVYVFDGAIGKTNYKNNELKGGWSLTRWQYEFLNQKYLDDYIRVGLMNASEAFPIRILSEYESEDNIGCLANIPLRYGDIEQDGKNELVLTTGEDLIVFSPEYERIVFMQRYNSLGWLNKEKSNVYLTENIDTTRKEEPQYLSRIGARTIEKYQFISPGVRAYAKIFEGDFDNNGYSDLVVWHKTYTSNLRGAQVGFSLLENKYLHYKRDLNAQAESETGITGEYLPQDTDQATIQTWLSENELTWSKGFPSVSECEGEEGKLIPEMHDPLLNDPDVLQ